MAFPDDIHFLQADERLKDLARANAAKVDLSQSSTALTRWKEVLKRKPSAATISRCYEVLDRISQLGTGLDALMQPGVTLEFMEQAKKLKADVVVAGEEVSNYIAHCHIEVADAPGRLAEAQFLLALAAFCFLFLTALSTITDVLGYLEHGSPALLAGIAAPIGAAILWLAVATFRKIQRPLK